MRPEISDETIDRLKKYVQTQERKTKREANKSLNTRGPGKTGSWTIEEALSDLLTKAGF